MDVLENISRIARTVETVWLLAALAIVLWLGMGAYRALTSVCNRREFSKVLVGDIVPGTKIQFSGAIAVLNGLSLITIPTFSQDGTESVLWEGSSPVRVEGIEMGLSWHHGLVVKWLVVSRPSRPFLVRWLSGLLLI